MWESIQATQYVKVSKLSKLPQFVKYPSSDDKEDRSDHGTAQMFFLTSIPMPLRPVPGPGAVPTGPVGDLHKVRVVLSFKGSSLS